MEAHNIKYQRVQGRIQELKKFYKNTLKLGFFIILLGTINYLVNGLDYPWFLWIIGLMSIGLGIDAIRTFIQPLMFKKWERSKIEELLQKDKF